MAWLLFWKLFVHYSSPGCECFAEDIVFVPFFSSCKVQSLGSHCSCRVWRFCRRERLMVPYSVQDKGTRLIIELYIAYFSPLSIWMTQCEGSMERTWLQGGKTTPKRTNNLPSQEKEVKNRDWHKTWSLQQDPKHNLMSSFWACLLCPVWFCMSLSFHALTEPHGCASRTKKLNFFPACSAMCEQNKKLSLFPACSAMCG
jgi:hypothetical protein